MSSIKQSMEDDLNDLKILILVSASLFFVNIPPLQSESFWLACFSVLCPAFCPGVVPCEYIRMERLVLLVLIFGMGVDALEHLLLN
ncbi:hypothetical protein CEXT_566701 [Caerostris extrusa]|uniref:Uncharacterized protein n=1 Tax=Caerostris extrusa TaxID=172846 RepID=A0AAV4WKZ8_CAEEX|nr:hypothetical protein CEXT_566701 [Caerostris extrusa]